MNTHTVETDIQTDIRSLDDDMAVSHPYPHERETLGWATLHTYAYYPHQKSSLLTENYQTRRPDRPSPEDQRTCCQNHRKDQFSSSYHRASPARYGCV
jgi:hypothetical protein